MSLKNYIIEELESYIAAHTLNGMTEPYVVLNTDELFDFIGDLEISGVPKGKVCVPDFIENLIEDNKGYTLYDTIYHLDADLNPYEWDFLYDEDNEPIVENHSLFEHAWVNGYVKAEKKFVVADKHGRVLLAKHEGKIQSASHLMALGLYGWDDELTQEEIEEYDEAYMAFAREV